MCSVGGGWSSAALDDAEAGGLGPAGGMLGAEPWWLPAAPPGWQVSLLTAVREAEGN